MRRKGETSSDVDAAGARIAQYVFDDQWFPDWWLVYLYLGEPAENNCRDSFLSGKAVSMASLKDIRDVAHKVNRRAIDTNEAKSGNSMSSSEGGSSSDKRQRLEITFRNPHVDATLQRRKDKIAMLKDAMETMKQMGMSADDDQFKGSKEVRNNKSSLFVIYIVLCSSYSSILRHRIHVIAII